MSAPRPTIGLTLMAPWPAFVLRGPKRLENRSQGVATIARRHVGELVAITASLMYERRTVGKKLHEIKRDFQEIEELTGARCSRAVALGDFARWAGCWVGTARLVDVLPPAEARKDPWSVHHRETDSDLEFLKMAGGRPQWGLILDDVVEIEPAKPATGGQGLWQVRWCACGRMMSSSTTPPCRDCKPAVPSSMGDDGWHQGSLL